MSTLPNPGPAAGAPGAYWQRCVRCDDLFPTIPGQRLCRLCRPARLPGPCRLAHPEDRSRCDGPRDAVRVVDQVGDQRYGCVHHAAVALASIEAARVYPGSVAGAAIEAYRRAQLREPFEFDPTEPWPVPEHPTQWGER